ncbi:MAG: HEAT repeat domain-containing protein [Parachlamydiaceae bacterium]|nr:HEAT repeat domain-containing protein [Parachlamydiaceae bacterium]
MKKFILSSLSCLCIISGNLSAEIINEEQLTKRVHAHMVIGDYSEACNEAFVGLQTYPASKILWQAYLRALAKAGDEKGLMANWRLFIKKFPGEACNREMLECLAWAVIENGSISASPGIRAISLLGAYFSQDAKGVALLKQGLSDNNSFLRAAALKLSSNLADASLQEGVLRLFKEEKVWNVRLEAIKAIGQLALEVSRDALTTIIAQQNSSAEEKAAAIQALVAMSDEMERVQIKNLIQSDRAGLRLLACELIAHFEQNQDVDLLLPLLRDHHAEVRAKALEVIGQLRIKFIGKLPVVELAIGCINDSDAFVGVMAAWVITLNDPERGMPAFVSFLSHECREVRHAAAAALAATGKYGVPLALKTFNSSQDQYVRMNLAIGLIGQRTQTLEACHCLYEALQSKERWMWEEGSFFRILAPSILKHDDAIPNYPEAINQLVRLNILEMLAIVHYPKTQQAVKGFLQERTWGLSGMASVLLLTEGDENAVDLVKALLQDNEQKVRMQAALILALWGKGEEAINVLQEAYPSADKELKGQILEGIGRVGSTDSLLFLADKLQEPYQSLRIVAAAALLECLYH